MMKSAVDRDSATAAHAKPRHLLAKRNSTQYTVILLHLLFWDRTIIQLYAWFDLVFSADWAPGDR